MRKLKQANNRIWIGKPIWKAYNQQERAGAAPAQAKQPTRADGNEKPRFVAPEIVSSPSSPSFVLLRLRFRSLCSVFLSVVFIRGSRRYIVELTVIT